MAGEAVLGAAVQVLLQNLLSVSFDEIRRTFGYKRDVTKLQKSLVMVQKFLSDAENKEINDASVKEWLKQLEDVAFEADAILDEFNYQLLCQKVKNQNYRKEKVLGFFSFGSNNLLFARKMARKIGDLNEKLEKINKDAVSYGLQMAVVSANHASAAGHVKTDSFYVEPNVVGRENDVVKMVEMVVTASPNETLHVFPIFGMGGLGKTTLARNVFNHEKIEAHFGKKMWVCVPIDFDAEILFKMILESLTGESVQGFLTKQVVLESIQKLLSEKRYLLVLDDIWNEEFNKWDDFIGSLSGVTSGSGNVILVTTRKEMIASSMKPLYAHPLDNLSDNDCWSIIKAKALLGVHNPEEYEATGKCIAQRCGGLPLAAKVVGGFLCGKSEDEWRSLLESQFLDFGQTENHVFKILKLSYDHLPSSSLKRCFAYFSVFPQHSIILREWIIRLWAAEGFLQGDQKYDMEIVGNRHFELLVQSSLLQDVERDVFGNITRCRMHSLVHDLACSISGTRGIHERNRPSNYMQVRYLAQSAADPYFISGEQAMFLRSFFFTGKVAHMLSGFSYLHTLTLANPDLDLLPREIEKLIHLRYLDIFDTNIKYMPDSVCRLFNLQTLYAPQYLIKFPDTLADLICLRHLVFPPIELPPGIGKLKSLQTLKFYKVGNEKGCRIGELGDLESLKGKLQIHNLERIKDKAEAEHADLFSKRNVYALDLRWNKARQGETNDENVLEGLQPQPNLKVLKINGYAGKNFPLWTMKMEVRRGFHSCGIKLKCVMHISLRNCQRCEEIPMLGHLPHLKILEFQSLPNVRCIGRSFYGYETSSNASTISSNIGSPGNKILFPALQRLYIQDMPNLTDWFDVEGVAIVFPCLSFMKIQSCQQLKSVPCRFPCLEELHLENLSGDFPFSNVFSNTMCLQKLLISELPGLVHLPEGLFINNSIICSLEIHRCPKLTRLVPCLLVDGASLRELIISYCESLSELPDDLGTLPSLEKLRIYHCPKLKSIPGVRGQSLGLISLCQLSLLNCRELTDLPRELLESCASTLSYLALSRLRNLATSSVISCLPRMSCLATLYLSNIPKLNSFPAEIIGCVRNLRHLVIGADSDSIDQVSFADNLNRILQDPQQHLESLCLIGKPDWRSPLVQTQYLTNLKTLELQTFGMEAFPEWLGNISSLEKLYIYHCKKLKHMPSEGAMQRLTKITLLDICRCPLMKKSFAGADNSEWAKISHIESVKIDGHPFTRDRWRRPHYLAT